MIRQRIKACLKRAVAQGVKLGRPKIDSATRKVRKQLAKGIGILKVAKVARDWHWHGAAHRKEAWLKPALTILPFDAELYVAPGRGTFQFQTFIPAPSPEIWAETVFGVRAVAGEEAQSNGQVTAFRRARNRRSPTA
jgi:hypothetical protein